MKRVSYFRYASFGPVVLYLGDIGSGITLGSIIQLVRSRTPRILTNIHLFNLPTEPFNLIPIVEKPDEYANSTVFLDNLEFLVDSRRYRTKQNTLFFYLLVTSRKLGIKFIFSSHCLELLDKRVRQSITDIVKCRFIPKQKLLLQHYKLVQNGRLIPISECLLKGVGKYYKYFNTLEMPNLPKTLLEVGKSEG